MPRSIARLSASESSHRDLSSAVFITNIAESDFRYTQGPELCYHKRRGDACFVEGIVTLIVYYVVFMIVGDFAAYFLGLFTEYEWGSQVSLIVFLALYFLFLWVSWVLAVRVTKPKTVEQQSS
jgi:uncharacterized membrane protein